jgi:uncharacterized membrane protein YgdD (TMEM256/DUF423 family)
MPPMTGPAALALIYAALNAACAVALGAWAAHGLGGGEEGAAATVGTAARYQMWHALALIAVVLLSTRMSGGWAVRLCGVAGGCFAAGQVFFVGGLLASAFAGVGWPAPIGGMLFIIGWLALAGAGVAAWRARA